MKRKRKIKIIDQDNGAIIFDKSRGIYFQVNHCGKILIKGLGKGRTREELILEIENVFGLDSTNAEKDVNEFLGLLKEVGLA